MRKSSLEKTGFFKRINLVASSMLKEKSISLYKGRGEIKMKRQKHNRTPYIRTRKRKNREKTTRVIYWLDSNVSGLP
jgi:hypothetical protein